LAAITALPFRIAATTVTDLQTGVSQSSKPDSAIVIEYPLSCAFNIKRGISDSPNSMDIEIINLSKDTRIKSSDRGNYYVRGAAM